MRLFARLGHNAACFDGSTAARAIPPKHVPSLLKEQKIVDRDGRNLRSSADQYCGVLKAYCDGIIRLKELETFLMTRNIADIPYSRR
jgi:hypothetical protein